MPALAYAYAYAVAVSIADSNGIDKGYTPEAQTRTANA